MAKSAEDGEEVFAVDDSEDMLELDVLVGHIENIILSDEFVALRESFMHEHCHKFEDAEENKLEYTDIFTQYTKLIEGHIERELSSREKGFNMNAFQELISKSEAVDGEVFDLLLTFTDFLSFKDAMLEAKKSTEDGSARLQDLLQVTRLSS